jgi:molybdopterin-guanine dinucleotide biosynthesis protein
MIEMPNMLLIAGNARNIGKTTLACAVIERFSALRKITGLKVSGIRKGEESYHGHHGNENTEMLKMYEEVNTSTAKDTARMLKAGAEKAFFMQVDDTRLHEIAERLSDMIPSDRLVVCESGSLRKKIKPGVFIFLHTDDNCRPVKQNHDTEKLADLVINCIPGVYTVLENIEKISLSKNRWIINN